MAAQQQYAPWQPREPMAVAWARSAGLRIQMGRIRKTLETDKPAEAVEILDAGRNAFHHALVRRTAGAYTYPSHR